jgi:hypothetical protein
MVQEVECLPSKCEALNSNPSTAINRVKMLNDDTVNYIVDDLSGYPSHPYIHHGYLIIS